MTKETLQLKKKKQGNEETRARISYTEEQLRDCVHKMTIGHS